MHALCRGRYSIQVAQGSSAKFAKMNKSPEYSLPLHIPKHKHVPGPRGCTLQTLKSLGLHSISLITQRLSSQEPGRKFCQSTGRNLQVENVSTVSPGAMQAKEKGTRKITASLLSQLVFRIHLRKSLTLLDSKALQSTLEPLPEHRMWSSAPSPLAMEILLIRIRISRFPANLKLERVIWGRRMQNKMLNDSLRFNKGLQDQPAPFVQEKKAV